MGDPCDEDPFVLAYSGQIVDTSADVDRWRLNYRFVVDVARIRNLPERVVDAVLHYLRELVRTRSPATVYSTSLSLCSSFELPGVAKLLECSTALERDIFEQIRRETTERTESPGYAAEQLGQYRRFYIFHADIGSPGFDLDVANGLVMMTLGGYRVGIAAASEDPDEGPLHRLEFKAVTDGLLGPRASIIPLHMRTAAWLSISFGCNPVAMALLDEKHFELSSNPGILPSRLWIPSTKKGYRDPTGSGRWLDVFAPTDQLIAELIASNADAGIDARFSRPLFRRPLPAVELLGTAFVADAYRCRPKAFADWLLWLAEKLDLRSLKGDRLHITPRRLRYTLIRRLVEQGATQVDLQFAIDHSDEQSLRVYFEPGPDFLKVLDRASALELAGFANAFIGRIAPADAESFQGEAIVTADATRRATDIIGACRATSCEQAPPVSCYKCSAFTALQGAPHERALDSLLERRMRLQAEGADQRMITLHDREILAIAGLLRRATA